MADLRPLSQHSRNVANFNQKLFNDNRNIQPQQQFEERGRTISKDSLLKPDTIVNTRDASRSTSASSINFVPTKDQQQQNRKKSSRAHHELLQQAILNQNSQFKSSLTRSISAHGIPHIDQTHQHIKRQLNNTKDDQQQLKQRPGFRRWNSYQLPDSLPQNEDNNSSNFINKDSISPLTVLKDQYDTKRPIVNNAMNMSTDNSYKELEKIKKDSTEDQIKIQPNLYEKMIHMANSGVNSLKSLTENAFSEKTSNLIQSESDDDDDNNNVLPQNEQKDTQYPIENLENDFNFPNEFNEMIKDITNFKNDDNNFPKLNRTQQKLMDYKKLYEYELENNNTTSNSLSYEFKIQNEKILSQYNNIRLRFSSREINKKQIVTDIGVLGFINRYKQNLLLNTTKNANVLSSKDTNELLKKIWDSEI
ncbi:uncharacterized protein KGF55_004037 [Candida pseudojiufengensis]|uniref:uncharacterized protein n=1 Tax=Candida pseudojiufengensis TaxID=497109 RepID=UPI002224DA3B|nr:uncharacterized protein KGF55_004037 [Candida pseudojiufengensis]KAI5961414.1 hypothetical protein KGF55_004037 [Candida pseudojiufengensis]